MEIAISLLERDFRFATGRGVRDQHGDRDAPLLAGNENETGELVRMTTTRPLPGSSGQQQLQRVAWRLEGDRLVRVTWPVLDRAQDTKEFSQVILEGMRLAEFHFLRLDAGNRLRSSGDWQDASLPDGVELVLETRSGLRLERLLETPGGGLG
jgi:general secretion pathway protein J